MCHLRTDLNIGVVGLAFNLWAHECISHVFGSADAACGSALLTFSGGVNPITAGLWLTDIAHHHHLAVGIVAVLLGAVANGVRFSEGLLHFFMLFVPVAGLWASAIGGGWSGLRNKPLADRPAPLRAGMHPDPQPLGFGLGPSGEVVSSYPFFVVGSPPSLPS